MYFALFLAGLLAGEAVRVGELTGQEKVNGSAVEQKAGVMMLGRLKAFDESGLPSQARPRSDRRALRAQLHGGRCQRL